jgi:NADH-quinone oxidoreductase subunit I
MLKRIFENTGALITGFATTFKYMFKPAVTINYPDQKSPMSPK